MRILVTGGAGFIGSHVCEQLLQRGEEVIIIDELNDFYDPAIKQRNLQQITRSGAYQFYQADIRNESQLTTIFAQIRPQAVIHLAARAGVRPSLRNPILYEEVNVIGTLRLLELCRQYPVQNFIFGSSSSVYGINSKLPFSEDDPITQPISPYATTKRSGELLAFNYAHLYQLPVTCLRFFTVYGPRQRPEMGIHKFTRQIFQGEAVDIYGDGQSRRDYTYIDDIVAGILAALDHPTPFAIYNLGNSSPVTLTQLITLIEAATGQPAHRRACPDQPGDVPVTYADIRLAQQQLGYQPRTNLVTGLAKFADWYRQQYLNPVIT
jgi:UDP-glucuronate 4-epimerase